MSDLEEINLKLMKEMVESTKSIEKSLKDLVVFFHSIEEMNLGDDDSYEKEIKKDGFHPSID